eukprot:13190585-Alexandrium_andersonii.AAC.1
MSASLVGSEMCIRDRCFVLARGAAKADAVGRAAGRRAGNRFSAEEVVGCLLYTSDAADDM